MSDQESERRCVEIPEKILEAIEEVSTYFGDENSWVAFKKELLKNLHPSQRTVFSTRDPKTKAQSLNELEKAIVQHWFAKTGVLLVLG